MFMVGGSDVVFVKVKFILDVMGKNIFYVGDVGNG